MEGLALLAAVVFVVFALATALSEDTGRELMALGPISLPLLNDAVLYDGSICCYDANGELQPGADTAGLRFAGVYRREKLDNADDGLSGQIDPFRPYLAACSGMGQSNVGDKVYLTDDNTVATTSTNLVFAGEILMVVSATQVWVAPPALCGAIKLSDLVFTAGVVADPASATSTNGAVTTIGTAINGLTFTAGGATGPEVEALQAQLVLLCTEVEKAADDARAALAKVLEVVNALQTLGILSAT